MAWCACPAQNDEDPAPEQSAEADARGGELGSGRRYRSGDGEGDGLSCRAPSGVTLRRRPLHTLLRGEGLPTVPGPDGLSEGEGGCSATEETPETQAGVAAPLLWPASGSEAAPVAPGRGGAAEDDGEEQDDAGGEEAPSRAAYPSCASPMSGLPVPVSAARPRLGAPALPLAAAVTAPRRSAADRLAPTGSAAGEPSPAPSEPSCWEAGSRLAASASGAFIGSAAPPAPGAAAASACSASVPSPLPLDGSAGSARRWEGQSGWSTPNGARLAPSAAALTAALHFRSASALRSRSFLSRSANRDACLRAAAASS